MKKWLSAALAALMLLSTAACAAPDDSDETSAGASTGKETVAGTNATTESAAPADTVGTEAGSAESVTTPGSSGEDTAENDSTTQTSAPVESETVDEQFPAVEKTDYKGAVFQMITLQNEPGSWYYAEKYINGGENVHVLNNTIYEMNTMVEDHLGVEIAFENVTVSTGHEVFNKVQPTLMSGDDAYQLCILHPYYDYNTFISGGYALDFYELDDLDLDKPYWNAEVMDRLSINGHAFIGLGDLCRYQLNMLYCNKDLLADAGKAVPYDLVRDQKWTLDELMTLTSGLYRDNNGNSERDYEDTYGYASLWDANATSFMQSSDIYVLTRNDENMYELSMYGDRLINLYEKLYKWSKDESFKLWNYGEYVANGSKQLIDFHDNRTYVTMDALGTQYLDAEFEVGILPLPKYDVAQENYAHPNWGNNLILPTTIRNKEMVGQVLEMMAYYSRSHVQQIYYNDVLQLRVSEAPDDREMVELIYNTVVFDPGIAYCDGYEALWYLVYLPAFNIRDGVESIASYYKRYSAQIEKRGLLEKIFDVPEPGER